jgi:hypothetical protein
MSSSPNEQSISLAYEASLKSYEWAMKRIEAWDANLHRILAIGIPLILTASGAILRAAIQAHSIPALIILLIAGIPAYFCVRIALRGIDGDYLTIVSPKILWENCMLPTVEDYRYTEIMNAQVHLDKNSALITAKATAAKGAVRSFAWFGLCAIFAWSLASF